MTVYVVGQISIHDPKTYERYVAGFMPVLKKYHGRLLAADTAPDVIEGEWKRHKFILLGFEDAESAHRWRSSPEYLEIAQDRLAATEGVVLLVHGLGAAR